MQLTTRQFFVYLRNIDRLEAHQQSLAFEAASFPQMKKEDRRKVQQHYINIIQDKRSTYQKKVDESWSILRAKRKLDGRRRSNITSKA